MNKCISNYKSNTWKEWQKKYGDISFASPKKTEMASMELEKSKKEGAPYPITKIKNGEVYTLVKVFARVYDEEKLDFPSKKKTRINFWTGQSPKNLSRSKIRKELSRAGYNFHFSRVEIQVEYKMNRD